MPRQSVMVSPEVEALNLIANWHNPMGPASRVRTYRLYENPTGYDGIRDHQDFRYRSTSLRWEAAFALRTAQGKGDPIRRPSLKCRLAVRTTIAFYSEPLAGGSRTRQKSYVPRPGDADCCPSI